MITARIIGSEDDNQLSRYEIQEKYEFGEKPMEKGDVVVIMRDRLYLKSLFICCPQCGDCSYTSTHKITESNGVLSVTPSLQFKCCGWHGHLTDGIFK